MRLVIIPVKNEEKTIRKTLLQLTDEVVVVVDNGDDNTASIAKSMGASVIRSRGEKYGDAILTGFNHADADQYIVMDSESHTFADIVPHLDCGADVIAGLRTGEKKPLFRKILTRIGRTMKPRDIDIKVVDISNGFRAYSQRFVDHLLSVKQLAEAPSYAFNAAVAFESEDFSVENFPMTYRGGKSGMTFGELWRAWKWRSGYQKQKPPVEMTHDDVVAFLRLHYGRDTVDDFCRKRHND